MRAPTPGGSTKVWATYCLFKLAGLIPLTRFLNCDTVISLHTNFRMPPDSAKEKILAADRISCCQSVPELLAAYKNLVGQIRPSQNKPSLSCANPQSHQHLEFVFTQFIEHLSLLLKEELASTTLLKNWSPEKIEELKNQLSEEQLEFWASCAKGEHEKEDAHRQRTSRFFKKIGIQSRQERSIVYDAFFSSAEPPQALP